MVRFLRQTILRCPKYRHRSFRTESHFWLSILAVGKVPGDHRACPRSFPRKTTGSKHDSLWTEWQFKNPGCSVLNVRLVVCSLLTPAWTLWACPRRLVGGEWHQECKDTSVLGARWPWPERQHSGAHNRQLYDSRLAFSVSSTQWGSLLVSVDLKSYFFLSLWTLLFRSLV